MYGTEYDPTGPTYASGPFDGPATGYPAALPYGFPPHGVVSPPPNNNLVFAVLATVLCFMPFGIVAIVKSTQVNTLWAQGDMAGAQRAARESLTWSMWSLITAAVLVGLAVLTYIGIALYMVAMIGVIGAGAH